MGEKRENRRCSSPALARRSEANVVIATKYAPLSGRGGARAIHKGLAGSLKRLGLQRVDLYQLHWADFEEVSIDDAMSAFAEIVHAGEASVVGVSNFRAAEIGKHMPPRQSAASRSPPIRCTTHCCIARRRSTACSMLAAS